MSAVREAVKLLLASDRRVARGKTISVRLPEEAYNVICELAEKTGQSVAGITELLLVSAIKDVREENGNV